MEERQKRDVTLTFEEAKAQLSEVVLELEKGELTLEEALTSFEKGIGLLRILVKNLNSFEERVEVLLDGFYTEAPSWLLQDPGGRLK